MSVRGDLLRQVMSATDTTQTLLSSLSGVHQPSISQFLSGKVELSDHQLDRLLSCMGYQLEIIRRTTKPDLTHSERRSWRLHRQLATHLSEHTLELWMPKLLGNLEREVRSVRGEVHLRHVERWRELIDERDLPGLRRVLTGLDRESIEMREVSPLGGLLSDAERVEVLRDLKRAG